MNVQAKEKKARSNKVRPVNKIAKNTETEAALTERHMLETMEKDKVQFCLDLDQNLTFKKNQGTVEFKHQMCSLCLKYFQ